MKNLFYSAIVFLVMFGIMELVLRNIYDLPDPYSHERTKVETTGSVIRLQNPRNKNINFIFNPTELFPKNEATRIPIHQNNFGFRHNDSIQETKKEFRIFALGGSTTQNYDYPYEKTWTQVLEKRLEAAFKKPINVYNGGTAGSAMVDHIALLQNRVFHLKPDYVILFVGVNDLNLLLGDNNLYRFQDIYENVTHVSWFRLALGKFMIHRLYLNAKAKMQIKHINVEEDFSEDHLPEHYETIFIDHNRQVKDSQSLPMIKPTTVNHDYYKSMIKSFIGACEANNIPILVMTQPTTWASSDSKLQKVHWMNKNKEGRFPKDFMQQNMDLMNENVAKICEELNIPNFRPEKVLPNNSVYFYDDCHFTPKGSIALGDSLADFIIKKQIIKI